MWSIEPKRKTVVKYSLTIVLDGEEEINSFLVDAAPLQKQVRSLRNQLYGHKNPNWATDGHGHAGGSKRGKKAGAKAAEKKSRTASAEQKCPHCGESFQRLARHLPACPNRDGGKPFDPTSE